MSHDERQRLAAGRLDLLCSGVDRARSFGCGSAVFAAMAMFAPSRAARSAIARPMPRDAPVMKSVLPRSDIDQLASAKGASCTKLAPASTLSSRPREAVARFSAKKRQSAMRPGCCRIRVARSDGRVRRKRCVGKRCCALRQAEEAKIGRCAGECVVGRVAGDTALRRKLVARSRLSTAFAQACAGMAESRCRLLDEARHRRAHRGNACAHRPPPDDGSLRVTRSIAWMPFVPS